MFAAQSLLVLASLAVNVLGEQWHLADSHIGKDFLSAFVYQAIKDPTLGRVNYVSQATALSKNLTFTNADSLIIRADHTRTLSASGAGRDSVRLMSKKQYTNHVTIWNIRHMPQGCATWPAIWEVGSNHWSETGEIDILEGTNDHAPNLSTLHTGAGCTIPAKRNETGTSTGSNCDSNATNYESCGVKAPQKNSFGPQFNAVGGGWYAMERTDKHIKIWYWLRNDPKVPAEVRDGKATISTGSWGVPVGFWPGGNTCDLTKHLDPHNLIINLTLCGSWAGTTFNADGCPGTCETYPTAFKNAFFNIAWVKVYE